MYGMDRQALLFGNITQVYEFPRQQIFIGIT